MTIQNYQAYYRKLNLLLPVGEMMLDIEKDFTPVAFGDRIKSRRYKAGLSQSRLAAKLGLSIGRLSQIERGDFKSIPRFMGLYGDRLTAALGCTVYVLTHRFDEPFTDHAGNVTTA